MDQELGIRDIRNQGLGIRNIRDIRDQGYWGLGIRVQGLEIKNQRLEIRDQGLGIRDQRLEIRDQGLGIRDQG